MAGVELSGAKYGPKKKKPNAVEEMYGRANTEYAGQRGDYNDIMSRFKDIYNQSTGGRGGDYSPYSADLATYKKSSDTTAALAGLKELMETGGLSGSDQQNLRARAISPIRSMYATSSRDMDRNRRLSGGGSANFGAVTSKMTRDMSSQIANQMDNVNGRIAEMIQTGKLSAAPNYASAAQAESELASRFELSNRDAKNQAKRDNAQGLFDAKRNQTSLASEAAKGMASLYGTTPARDNLHGNVAQDARNFEADQKQKKRSAGIQLFGAMTR